jgi:hypothetical protein
MPHTIYNILRKRHRLAFAALLLVVVLTPLVVYLSKQANVASAADSLFGFDEGYGDTVSDSSGAASGTITGASWQTSDLCRRDKCLYFDGASWINFGDENSYDFSYSDTFTIQFWFRHAPATSAQVIMQKYEGTGADGGFRVQMESDGDISFGVDNDNSGFPTDSVTSTAADYDDNRWHHVSAVRNGATGMYLYIDGNLVASNTSLNVNSGTLANDDTFYIGDSDGTDNGDEFVGFLDEVKIYTSTARSADEVKADLAGATPDRGTSASFGPDTSYLSDGLIGYWPTDEAVANTCSGGVNDSCDKSGNAKDGAWTGNATNASGKYGNAVTFDGNGDYINLGDHSIHDLSFPFSIFAWININNLPSTRVSDAEIVSKYGGAPNRQWTLSIGDDDVLYFWASYNGTNGQYPFSSGYTFTADHTNTWVHVGITADTSGATIMYVDGVQVYTGQFNNLNIYSGASVQARIGSRGTNANYFDGEIDEARIYNRALSPAEVQKLYNWAPGPVGYWKMDENTGYGSDAVKDTSGNDLHGTTNGTLSNSSWVPGKLGSAINLNGSSDYISVADPGTGSVLDFASGESITISAWFKPASLPANNSYVTILTKGGIDDTDDMNYWLGYGVNNSNSVISLCYSNLSSSLECYQSQVPELSVNTWQHISATYTFATASSMKLYYNGSLKSGSYAAGTGTVAPYVTNKSIWIGADNYATCGGICEALPGNIDDVRIYNYARTPAQIVEDMNAGHPAPGSPVGSALIHFKFDENFGFQGGALNSGTDPSLSGYSINATRISNGKFNQAVSFAATSNSIDLGDVSFTDSATAITFSLWINPQSLVTDATIIDKTNHSTSNSFLIRTDSTNSDEIRYYVASSGTDTSNYFTTSNLDLTEDIWQHLTFVYDGSQAASDRIKIYKDGLLVAGSVTGTIPASFFSQSTPSFRIGDSGISGSESIIAYMDDFKIFLSSLSTDQVKVLASQSASAALGALGTDTSGNPDNSTLRTYCVPGDTATCNIPIGHYAMDENVSEDTSINQRIYNLTDGGGGYIARGSNYTANDTADPQYVPGILGTALEFDGTDDRGETTVDDDALDFGATDDLTIEAWFYRDTFTTNDVIVSKKSNYASNRQGYVLWIDGTSNDLRFQISDGGGTAADIVTIDGTTAITSPGWHHVAVVLDKDTEANSKIYLDGIDDTEAVTGTLADIGSLENTLKFMIGRIGTTDYFDGKIDNLILYRYVRTPAQIAWTYNRGGPVGWWKLDDGGTGNGLTLYDSSGFGNNGTSVDGGGTALDCTVTGKRNTGCSFDGANDYINMGDPASGIFDFGTRDFTVGAWVKTTHTSFQVIASKVSASADSGYSLRMAATGYPQFIFDDSTSNLAVSSVLINDGEWHHVVGVRSASTNMYIYVDGIRTGSDTISAAVDVSSTLSFMVGRRHGGDPAGYFNGTIDDVKVYNHALTDEQIKMEYNSGAVRFE